MANDIIHGEATLLRQVTPADLDLLTTWFSDPEVNRWWDGYPKPREEVAQKYIGGRRPQVESFIIEAEAEPIGYIQYALDSETSGGIDMFLIPSARERGLGPDAARAMVRYLLWERHWRRVTVDPFIANPRAIHAWGKAGFKLEREVPDHPGGPALLMVIEADNYNDSFNRLHPGTPWNLSLPSDGNPRS